MRKCSHEVCFVFKTLFHTLLKLKIKTKKYQFALNIKKYPTAETVFLFSKSFKDSISQIIIPMIRYSKVLCAGKQQLLFPLHCIISSEFVKDWNYTTERTMTTLHTWSKEKSEELWIYFFTPPWQCCLELAINSLYK